MGMGMSRAASAPCRKRKSCTSEAPRPAWSTFVGSFSPGLLALSALLRLSTAIDSRSSACQNSRAGRGESAPEPPSKQILPITMHVPPARKESLTMQYTLKSLRPVRYPNETRSCAALCHRSSTTTSDSMTSLKAVSTFPLPAVPGLLCRIQTEWCIAMAMRRLSGENWTATRQCSCAPFKPQTPVADIIFSATITHPFSYHSHPHASHEFLHTSPECRPGSGIDDHSL
jgi:hypothetical protein